MRIRDGILLLPCVRARPPMWRSQIQTPRRPRIAPPSRTCRARARMPQPDEIASLIRGLCEPDPGRRERSAAEIFRRGSELARAAAAKWLADAELARLFVLGDAQFPPTTIGLAVAPKNFERIR